MATPFKGMGGGMDMGVLKNLQKKLLEDGKKMQERLTEARIEGASGGAVKATVDGHGNLISMTIDPEAVTSGDTEMLQDMLVSAVSEAQTKAEDLRNAEQEKMMPNIPGMSGMF